MINVRPHRGVICSHKGCDSCGSPMYPRPGKMVVLCDTHAHAKGLCIACGLLRGKGSDGMLCVACQREMNDEDQIGDRDEGRNDHDDDVDFDPLDAGEEPLEVP